MAQLESSITTILSDLYHHAYVETFLIIVLACLANYISHLFFRKVEATMEKREGFIFSKILIKAAKSPIHYLIIIIAAMLLFDIFSQSYKFLASKQFLAIETSFLIITVLWLIIGLINEFEIFWLKDISVQDKKFDKTSISASSKIMRISACVIVALILLDVNGISISGILAFGGVSGIAVGFASKDMLSNFFGTFMIYLDKPFKIGDWVKIPDKGIEGTIESIGMRCTIIRSLERRPIYIPNSLFTNVAIENPSRMSHRQINETFSIRYEDLPVVETIIADIKEFLQQDTDIDKKQPLVVSVSSISNAVITILIYGFTKKVDFIDFNYVKQKIFLNISKIVAKHEAEITYVPQSISAAHPNAKSTNSGKK